MAPKVFLSTVTTEFGSLRAALARSVRHSSLKVVHQDDFAHRGVLTLQTLEEEIRGSEIVFHILGAQSGAPAPAGQVRDFLQRHPAFQKRFPEIAADGLQGKVSYTQWEAWMALYFEKRLAVFQIDVANTEGAQQAHARRLRDHDPERKRHPKRVSDPFQLIGEMIASLLALHLVSQEELTLKRLAKPRFLHHTAEFFLGREDELALLDRAWADGTHVLSIIAWGGVGKTALLSQWIQTRFIDKHWQDTDGRPSPLAYFDWSFYDQGTQATSDEYAQRPGSVGDFFEHSLTHFGDPDVTKPGKGQRLAELVRHQRTLVILDGLEPLQQPLGSPTAGRLLDPDLRDFVTLLAQANPGLCLLTSRQALTDLDGLQGSAARKEDLDDLPKAVAVRLLRQMQITGTDQELEEACDKFGCHALSLTLLGRFLFDAHQGDIRRIDRVKDLRRADELTREERHRTAWKVLEAYEAWLAGTSRKDDHHTVRSWIGRVLPFGPFKPPRVSPPTTLAVLRLTGLFDRTATPDCLAALRAEPVIAGFTEALVGMGADEWNILLRRLERAHLIKLRTEPDGQIGIDAHPLVREYFSRQLRDKQPEAFRAAHARLFEHLCRATPYRPDTLDGLQPLYQAVVHGCLAGREQEAFDEVYFDRIQRGNDFYSTRKLGAIGADLAALAAFFDEPWNRVSPNRTEAEQAWLLNQAAFRLRALGRLTEALQPLRAGLEMAVQQKDWQNASAGASNLSQLDVTLGRLTDAVADARQSIAHAYQSGIAARQIGRRSTLAYALHESGQRAEAGALFAEAEQMNQEMQSEFDLLYSLEGFLYCDWLLAPAERAAWQALVRGPGRPPVVAPEGREDHAPICADVERRAKAAQAIAMKNRWLLDIALDHLTLARVGLIRAMLTSPLPHPALDLPHVTAAVNGLRNAGQMDQLPRGLLTAVLYHFVRGDTAAARAALEQAQEIAARGPMPLYLADVHLHRARLFRDRAELAKAAQFIRDLGYGRRFDELADAEAAAAHWPTPPR
jgi:hypothetical protein